MGALVIRLLKLLSIERHEIGRVGLSEYLTRWVVFGRRGGSGNSRRNGPGPKLFLHHIHRSDAEAYPHNHPWSFWSLILWGGYFEWTPDADYQVTGRQSKKWYGLLSLLRRPAKWQHRLELPEGKKCWTLVWTGPKEQSWGFACQGKGIIPWRQHATNQAAGIPGCGVE